MEKEHSFEKHQFTISTVCGLQVAQSEKKGKFQVLHFQEKELKIKWGKSFWENSCKLVTENTVIG